LLLQTAAAFAGETGAPPDALGIEILDFIDLPLGRS